MSVTEEELINYVLGVASQMKPDELKTTVQEATSCILCALYGVSSNVTHETKPLTGGWRTSYAPSMILRQEGGAWTSDKPAAKSRQMPRYGGED